MRAAEAKYEAARHAPWHFIVITEQDLENRIMEYFRQEQVARARLKMKFPTPDYRGLATAPRCWPCAGRASRSPRAFCRRPA